MLNFANLNDMEFEELCRDVMSGMLGLPFRSFARGRDQGVDLTDDVITLQHVVQVKHYVNSGSETLVRKLKQELPKVQKLKPGQYYICCSQRLSRSQIDDLYQHFREYMDSANNIITGDKIDDFLKKNKDIVRKHYKLWIEGSGILENLHNRDCFVDCEVLLSDIERDCRRFVRTKAFDCALESLEKRNVLCIVGSPGVGKTMTSKMLVMHYAALGYRVRYSSDVSNLMRLKDSLAHSDIQKEVILVDDCFGQAYFEMKSGQGKELVELIKYIKNRPGKILILNSRYTIYQEARQKEEMLDESREADDYRELMLNIGELTLADKARMFYNHLYFYQIPEAYFEALRKNRGYAAVVEHPNFNPRIIEYICSPHRFGNVSPEGYRDLVLHHLDNPKRMWQNEYEHKLQSVDRILLQTIYSLTSHVARKELVEKCFVRRIERNGSLDRSRGLFHSALSRLKDGMIQEVTVRGERMLGMVNPSVNDFLDGYLEENPEVKREMVNSICNMWQITRLIPSREIPEYCANLIRTGEIHDLIYRVRENKPAFVSYFLLSQQIKEESCRKELWDFLDHPIPLYFHIYLPSRTLTNAILEYMNQEIWDFYQLDNYFSRGNRVYKLLKIYDFSGAVGCITLLMPFFRNEMWDKFTQQAMRCLQEKIDSFWDDIHGRMITKSIIDIEQVLERVTAYESEGPKLNVEYMEQILHSKVAHKLAAALKKLGQPFDSLADYVMNHIMHISEPEKFAEEYRVFHIPAANDQGTSDPVWQIHQTEIGDERSLIDELFMRKHAVLEDE